MEAMVVLALFAVLGVSLFSSFSMGMNVWRRATSPNFSYRKSILALERLSRELRCAYDYPPLGFYGEKTRISFADLFADKVLNITYSYAAQEKALTRAAVSMQGMSDQQKPAGPRTIVTGVKDLALSYYGYDTETRTFGFWDSWNYTKSWIPLSVRVSMTLEDGNVLEKNITIPIAQ